MNKALESLKTCIFLQDFLLNDEREHYHLTAQEFKEFLEKLVKIDTSKVPQIIESDSKSWMLMVSEQQLLKDIGRPEGTFDKDKFKRHASERGFEQLYEEMVLAAQELQDLCDNYLINYFQVFAAAAAIHDDRELTTLKVGTGCGKSFIAGILSVYLYNKGLRTAIITSDDFLATQLEEMLMGASEQIDILSMQNALRRSDEYDGFIIDEADRCLIDKGVAVDYVNSQLLGFWDLLRKKTFLLTASVPKNLNKLLKDLYNVGLMDVLDADKFSGVEGQATLKQDVSYCAAPTDDDYWLEMSRLINEHKKEKPIIVFFNKPGDCKKLASCCSQANLMYNEIK